MRIFPILMLAISMPLCAQSPQISPPLNDGEKRRILGQLYELHSCRDEVRAYRDYVSRDTELESREKASADRALDLERQAAALARRERDLERDRANTYEQLYRSVTKKPGIGCRLARILTLGLARCR